MTSRSGKFILAIVAGMVVSVGAEGREWEDPKVNSINRLPARTYSMPLAAEADALTDEIEPRTPYAVSLNGEWKFRWTGDPKLRPADFWKPDFDDSDWYAIDVPSCVEMRGWGVPHYTNQKYPHADLSHPTNAAFAAIRDRESGKADFNPVSSYRRTFTVPESWKDRRVILRFDGVAAAYYVWVNGHKVGYAEDSKLPSEFDITPYLNRTIEQSEQCFGGRSVQVVRRKLSRGSGHDSLLGNLPGCHALVDAEGRHLGLRRQDVC